MPSYTLAYSDAFGNGVRPYLALTVTGINGRSGRIVGLIDSGADKTSLPMGYAGLMGYGVRDLTAGSVGVADGSTVSVWHASAPSQAFISGLPDPVFDLLPTFVPGIPPVLFGREDFFQTFGVAFNEVRRQFTLTV